MGTMFRLGFRADPFWMGQTMAKTDLDQLLAALDTADTQMMAVEDWKKNHPDPRTDLGADYDGYSSFSDDERKYGSAAQAVHEKLMSADPTAWAVDKDYQDAAGNWAYAVKQLYSIVADHPKSAPPAPVPLPVPTPPSVAAAMPAPAVTAPSRPPIGQIAAGGAVALGIGVLLYAVLS